MVKSQMKIQDGHKGVELTIMGNDEVLFNEFRAIFNILATNVKLNRIATDALDSLAHDEIIKNYKENK